LQVEPLQSALWALGATAEFFDRKLAASGDRNKPGAKGKKNQNGAPFHFKQKRQPVAMRRTCNRLLFDA
jgi:hypothetical protein